MRILVGSKPEQVIAKVGTLNYMQYYGMLCSPRDRKTPEEAIALGVPWAIDNFAYAGLDAPTFIRLLQRYQKYPSCQWVVAPDVVANAELTLRKFWGWAEVIRSHGYPVALAAQDGLENMVIPWDAFECLFIGGSTEWKLGFAAAAIAREAKRRDKWVHMGRVNSDPRIVYANAIGCDSADGSSYASFTKKNIQAIKMLKIQQGLLWNIA